jgi:ribosomal-protein-alanine N-acetyltransferase
MNIPTLTTARLILRGFTDDDVDPLYRILSDADVLRYFPDPRPPSCERVQKIISNQLQHWERHGYGWWALEPRSNKDLIGWSGLQFISETTEVEVGYLLGQPFWGQGLATEAAQACVRYGFEQLGLQTIVGIVHPENVASQRVIGKLGLSFVDRTRYFGMDCYHYRMECPPGPRRA